MQIIDCHRLRVNLQIDIYGRAEGKLELALKLAYQSKKRKTTCEIAACARDTHALLRIRCVYGGNGFSGDIFEDA